MSDDTRPTVGDTLTAVRETAEAIGPGAREDSDRLNRVLSYIPAGVQGRARQIVETQSSLPTGWRLDAEQAGAQTGCVARLTLDTYGPGSTQDADLVCYPVAIACFEWDGEWWRWTESAVDYVVPPGNMALASLVLHTIEHFIAEGEKRFPLPSTGVQPS